MNRSKKSLLLAGVLSLALVACSGWNVPSAAKDGLKRDFPEASRVEWEKTETGLYEAEFLHQGNKVEAYYTVEGTLELAEEKLRQPQLPEAVQSQLRSLFPGRVAEEIIRRTDADGAVFYAVELDDLIRIFATDGTFLGPYDARVPQPATPTADTSSLAVDSI